MKRLIFLFNFLWFAGNTVGNEVYMNNYSNLFSGAYNEVPGIPRGVLEAVSYTKTHFRHIKPDNEPASCIGLPAQYGVMGLIRDEIGRAHV